MEKDKSFDFYDKTSLKVYNLNERMRYQLGVLDSLDAFTRNHSENVASITCRLCEYLHKNKDFTVFCTICAYLHDIGKTFIPPKILQKNGPLTDEEYEVIKTHTTIGYKMCMDDPQLRKYFPGPKFHHEALDGSGYPEGLTKKDIPMEGQIIRVADEFDALVSKRQYKSHIGIVDTLQILIDETIPNPENPNHSKYGKTNKKVVKALLKVVIADTNYEISSMFSYTKYLKEQIRRLDKIKQYYDKMESTSRKSKKEYLETTIKLMFNKGETLENFQDVLNEYNAAYIKRKQIIDKLFSEIKHIKKLKV